MTKRSKQRKRPRARDKGSLVNPIQGGPEKLLDGKTFTFKQYVPISSAMLVGAPVTIEMNVSPNGYEYQLTGPTPLTFGQLWGESLVQFEPLALLYETYTVLDVHVEAVPSYPGLIYGVTPGAWAIQTAESRTVFIPPFNLATQVNASLTEPLKRSSRMLNYQPYLQQNQPESYLLTFDQSTNSRQLFGVSTSATVTPLITHFQQFTPYFSASEDDIPFITYILTARLHFRGRQNQVSTVQQLKHMHLPQVELADVEIGVPILGAKDPPPDSKELK